MTRVFTVISCNYLAEARVLMRSVAENWPDAKRTVFVTDSPEGKFDPQKEEFEVVEARLTALPRYRHLAFAFSPGEFCFVLKTFCGRHLLARGDADALVYLDSDMLFLRRPGELEENLRKHSILLTPHRLKSEPEETLHISQLRGGAFNAGFFAVQRCPEAESFLRWWGNQVIEPVNLRAEWFFDQGWLNLVPAFFSGLGILRHPGYNAAFWNLRERGLEGSPVEGWRCGNAPLILFHFSLFDAQKPTELTGATDYTRIGPNSALDALLQEYKRRLDLAGWSECHRWAYDHGNFSDGKKITPGHRKYFQLRGFRDVAEKHDPFDSAMEPKGLKSLYHFDHPLIRLIRTIKGTEIH